MEVQSQTQLGFPMPLSGAREGTSKSNKEENRMFRVRVKSENTEWNIKNEKNFL